uniref:Uncharacterized protein n=1 Tax=Sphaerodactylus townsendi TaxID=933632 RepID=A0ACB8EC00_9SAUR
MGRIRIVVGLCFDKDAGLLYPAFLGPKLHSLARLCVFSSRDSPKKPERPDWFGQLFGTPAPVQGGLWWLRHLSRVNCGQDPPPPPKTALRSTLAKCSAPQPDTWRAVVFLM